MTGRKVTPLFQFRCASLPKPIYFLLKEVAETEEMSQREVVVAGIMALRRLRGLDAAQAADVIAEARKLCQYGASSAA